jgi:hypothetical protein
VDAVEARARQSYACRVCGHRGTEPDYGPSCLAETMVRVEDPGDDPEGDLLKGETRGASVTTGQD